MYSLYISLIVLFIHSTTWDGMINQWIKEFILPEGMLYKPIYGCPICMTPWWGTLFYVALGWNNLDFQTWFWTVGGASGLSVVWVCLLSLRDWAIAATDKLDSEK